jgi:hypothetical protein
MNDYINPKVYAQLHCWAERQCKRVFWQYYSITSRKRAPLWVLKWFHFVSSVEFQLRKLRPYWS